MDNSENIVESNEHEIPSQSIEKSLNSGVSNSDKETDIINEDEDYSGGNIETTSSSSLSSSNEVSNDDEDDDNNNNNNNIINNSD